MNGRFSPRTAGALALATLACLLPWTGKAFHVDDPPFVWLGQHLLRDPLDFYGFELNWRLWPLPMHEIMYNPPLAGYYAGLAGAALGFGERSLHAAFLLPALAAVLGTYALATRLCGAPGLAALLTLFTPVFLVSASSIMCDTLMTALFVGSVACWRIGLCERRPGLLAAGGALAAAAALTKYSAAGLIPLLLVSGLAERRRLGAWALPLAFPVAALAAYDAASWALYGHSLLFSAAETSRMALEHSGAPFAVRVLVGLSFTGGCLASALFAAPLLLRGRALLAFAGLAAGIAALLARADAIGAFAVARESGGSGWGVALQVGLWAAVGLGVLALALSDALRTRSPDSLLLLLWVAGTWVFASFVNWSVNARSILPMAPALGVLVVRRLEWHLGPPARARGLVAAALLQSAALALLVTWADVRAGAAAREAARALAARHATGSNTLWFMGHWGFQYYAEALGMRAVDFRGTPMQPGDVVVMPHGNVFVGPPALRALERAAASLRPLPALAVDGPDGLTTHDGRVGAGFYSDRWGPLPFALARPGPEVYRVFQVTEPLLFRP